MKLLIVDDHAAMRRLIGRVVSDMVSEIEECGDGAEALDAYHRCLPDWVLMDIDTPTIRLVRRLAKREPGDTF